MVLAGESAAVLVENQARFLALTYNSTKGSFSRVRLLGAKKQTGKPPKQSPKGSHNGRTLRLTVCGSWQRLHGPFNVTSIMRTSLDLPQHLVRDAALYSPSRDPLDAVCHVLEDYPRLVAEVRQLRSQLREFNTEASAFDERLERLQASCRAILDL